MDTMVRIDTTNYFLGVCQPCNRPVRDTATTTSRYTTITCPQCHSPVRAERLVAVTTEDVCDGRCMGAAGPNCSCACGGVNHGRAFGVLSTHEELESALEAYRNRLAAAAAKRDARQAREQAAQRALFDQWLAAGNTDVVEYLTGPHAPIDNEFIDDMTRLVERHRPLTDRQAGAVRKFLTRHTERQQAQANYDATKKPCPTGKGLTIEGVVEQVIARDSEYAYNRTEFRMRVVCDGYTIWSTVPRKLFENADGFVTGNRDDRLTGKRVRFVADVEQSRTDESVGNAKRPRQAVRV